MSNDTPIHTIKIFHKEYFIKCPAAEHAELKECAKIVEQKMREIHQSGKVVGQEKIAITAALNIARDLLREYNKKVDAAKRAQEKIERLEQKINKLREKA